MGNGPGSNLISNAPEGLASWEIGAGRSEASPRGPKKLKFKNATAPKLLGVMPPNFGKVLRTFYIYA